MQTTVQFLDAIKAARGISDYALAKLLAVRPSAISNYRTQGTIMSADIAPRVAELLALDPAYVVACVNAERAERDQRSAEQEMWTRIAQRFAAAVLLTVSAHAALAPSPAVAKETRHTQLCRCVLC